MVLRQLRSCGFTAVAAFVLGMFCRTTTAAAQTSSSTTIVSSLPSGTVIPGTAGPVAGTFDVTSSMSSGEHVQSAIMTFDLVDNTRLVHLPCQASANGLG